MDFVWLAELPWSQLYVLLLGALVVLLGVACSVGLVELALVALMLRADKSIHKG